jgi:large subunit ribosomal protein L22
MKYRYAFKTEKENVVRVVGRDLPLSRKQAIELCSFIRNKPLAKIRAILEKVQDQKIAVPFNRYTEGAGHKKGAGMASGKYPLHGSRIIISLLDSLEANAQNKGLSSNLMIIHACAQQAPRPFHSGRQRRIKMKRVHIELAAMETEPEKKEKKADKSDKSTKTDKPVKVKEKSEKTQE